MAQSLFTSHFFTLSQLTISISFSAIPLKQKKELNSLKPIKIFFLSHLSFSLFSVGLHLVPSFFPPLGHLAHGVEDLLLVVLVEPLLELVNLGEDLVRIVGHQFVQFFQLFLEFSVLSHGDLVGHIEIALIVRVGVEEGSKSTSGLFGKLSIIRSDPLLFPFDFSPDLLNHLPSVWLLLLDFDSFLLLQVTHC